MTSLTAVNATQYQTMIQRSTNECIRYFTSNVHML